MLLLKDFTGLCLRVVRFRVDIWFLEHISYHLHIFIITYYYCYNNYYFYIGAVV